MKFISLTVVIATFLVTPALAAENKTLLLISPVVYSTTRPGLGTPMPRVAKQVELMSGGSLKMKVYEPGKLVAAFESLDVVSSGKINSWFATAGYWAGKIPAAPTFSAVPFEPATGEYMAWLYYGNGLALYQEMYDQAGYNVHVIPCAIIAPETSGWFAKQIKTQEDLQGLKMRFFDLGSEVMQRFGVAASLCIPSSLLRPTKVLY